MYLPGHIAEGLVWLSGKGIAPLKVSSSSECHAACAWAYGWTPGAAFLPQLGLMPRHQHQVPPLALAGWPWQLSLTWATVYIFVLKPQIPIKCSSKLESGWGLSVLWSSAQWTVAGMLASCKPGKGNDGNSSILSLWVKGKFVWEMGSTKGSCFAKADVL